MDKDDKLIRIIQEKLSEEAPAFKAEYWQEAAAQMEQWDQEKNEKKSGFLFWIFFLGILGLGSFIYFLGNNSPAPMRHSYGHHTFMPPVLPLDFTREVKGISMSKNSPLPLSATSISEKQPSSAPYTNSSTAENSLLKRMFDSHQLTPDLGEHQHQHQPHASSEDEGLRDIYLGFMAEKKFPFNQPIHSFFDDPIPLDSKRRIGLSIVVGGSISPSALNSESPKALFHSPQAGLEVQLPIKKKWTLTTGLNYWESQMNGLSLTDSATQYGFSYNKERISWQGKNVYGIQLPLRVGRSIGSRQFLEAGLGLSYIWGSRGELTLTQENGFGVVQKSVQKLDAMKQGLVDWGVSAQLGYQLKVFRRVSLGLLYQADLRDLAQDDFYKSGGMQAGQRFRFMVKYQIR